MYALKKPCCLASKPKVRRASIPKEINFETEIIMFWWFLGPADQNELYHTPLLYEIQGGFFNWSAQISVLKRKTLFNQRGSLVHRELHGTDSLIG